MVTEDQKIVSSTKVVEGVSTLKHLHLLMTSTNLSII